MTINNLRIALAGGAVAAVAVITPIAVIAASGDSDPAVHADSGESQDPNLQAPAPAVDPAADEQVEYVQGSSWHRADGSTVELPGDDYSTAVVWEDQLVVQHVSAEPYAETVIIGADGEVVETVETTGGLAASEDGSILSYITADGELITRWTGGQSVQAGTFEVNHSPVAVTGEAPCEPESGACLVWVNDGEGGCDAVGAADAPGPMSAIKCLDASEDGLLTYVDVVAKDHTCSGPMEQLQDFRWHTCEFLVDQISPDGNHIIGLPSYFDGLGPTSISVLDAETGKEIGRYGAEGGFVAHWAWSEDGLVVFDVYDGANWHLMSMAPNGALEELTKQVKGDDTDSPFTLVHH